MDLGGSVGVGLPARKAKKGAMAARRARGATGGGADKKERMGLARRKKREDDEAEHRERQGNGGGGQEGEETVDDKTSEGSEIREMRGDFRHWYGPESCTRSQRNPFECGCLDVNFESRGARKQTGEKGKGASELEPRRANGTARPGSEGGKNWTEESTGDAKWGAGIRINGGIQGPGWRTQRGKGQALRKNVGEDRERQPG